MPRMHLFPLIVAAGSLASSDWPQFRGPSTTGVVEASAIPSTWGPDDHVRWSVPVASGWSQPVVVGDVVFLTEAVGEGLETPIGFQAGVADPRTMKPGEAPDVVVSYRVRALDLATGVERWAKTLDEGKPRHAIHPSNTYATETPAADAERVVVYFGMSGTLAALDHAGKELWRKDLGTYRTMQEYGTGASPALHDGRVFVQVFTQDTSFLAAFDATTGEELWRVVRDEPATSWSSPLVWSNTARTEIVVSGGKRITSHDPATGAELWRLVGVDGPGLCSFGADRERVYLGQKGPGSSPPLYALRAGAEGDLSTTEDRPEIASLAWSQKAASPGMPSPVASGGLLYVASENVLACRDAATGELVYKERVPGLVTIAASPIVVGDRVLLLDEEGHATFVPVGREFRTEGGGALEGLFWATPSVAGDALLLRSSDRLTCLGARAR